MYYGFAESVIIAGPRNAHRRPFIPPLAILFSSLFARSPCPSPGHQGITFPGAQPPSRAARSCLFFPPLAGASSRHVDAPILQSLSACAAGPQMRRRISTFQFSLLRPLVSLVRACLPLRISRSRIPWLSITGLTDDADATRCAPTFPSMPPPPARKNLRGNLLSKCAANIRSRANRPARLYLRWIFDGLLEASILLAIGILPPQLVLAN